MNNLFRRTPPLKTEDLEGLHAGDRVLLSGTIYCARDAAHLRLFQLLERHQPLPFDIRGQIIYYMGPSPARPGMPIGAAGPTTSYRMDAYAPQLIACGLKGMVGKGARNHAVREAVQKYGAVYFAAIGGAGALISKCILESEIVAYPELGAEAIRRLQVKDFPVFVVNDIHGGDLYEESIRTYTR